MERRHLLEEEHKHQTLKEINNLQSMKELVDWESFISLLEEVFDPTPVTNAKLLRFTR